MVIYLYFIFCMTELDVLQKGEEKAMKFLPKYKRRIKLRLEPVR